MTPGERSSDYVDIFLAESIRRPMPTTLPDSLTPEFVHLQDHLNTECFVARVRNGRVLSDRGTVLTPDHKLLFDVSNQMSVRRDFSKVHLHQANRRNVFPPIQSIEGTVVVLAVAAGGNYFHWLTEALPRICLLEKSGLGSLSDVDSFVINSGPPFIAESLEILGIETGRCIAADWNTHIEARELWVPSLPGVTLNPPAWACEFLRERLLPHRTVSGKGRRLYIRRGQTTRRFVRNEEEIVSLLEDFGFVSIDPGAHSLKDQMGMFAEAEIVIGSHGAALANLLWCKPGTKVLELLPHHQKGEWFWPYCYWALSDSCGLEYHCMESIKTDSGQEKELYADQEFSPEKIRHWLESAELGIEPSRVFGKSEDRLI
tara:strand:- start:9366 stop:10484 length:1119 start_codon:yes stop_codon:yes gene_type:complete